MKAAGVVWRPALLAWFIVVGVAILTCWILPVRHPFFPLLYLGYVLMPAAMVAMRQPAQADRAALSNLQVVLIGVVGYTNIVFVLSAKAYLETGLWRLGHFAVSERILQIGSVQIGSESLVSLHAFSALLMALLMTAQWLLMLCGERGAAVLRWHRRIGLLLLLVVLPVMASTAVLCSLYVLKTPFNQVTYAALPFLILICLVRSLRAVLTGDRGQHVDSAYAAFVILCSAPIYRFVCLFLVLLHGTYRAPSGFLVDAAAIITYGVLILLLALPAVLRGRLRPNLLPIFMLLGVLLSAMLFVPWQFYGAPALAPFVSHLQRLEAVVRLASPALG